MDEERWWHRLAWLVAALTLVSLARASGAIAMPVPSETVPISRLTHHIESYLRKHPGDPAALYTLGRVHYFAFASRSPFADTFHKASGSGEKLPVLYQRFDSRGMGEYQGRERPHLSDAARLHHVREAISSLWRAHESNNRPPTPPHRDEGNAYANDPGLYELCLACALAEGSPDAARVGVIPDVPLDPTATQWRNEALRFYGIAFSRAAAADSQLEERPLFGLPALISWEAGRSYKATLAERGGEPTAEEAEHLAQIERHLARLDSIPQVTVTPIVFSLAGARPLDDLIDARPRVRFDLDGLGLAHEIPWPRPDAALLAWDPENTGRITSGRQLFGSVTWWLFWNSGYDALAALDDNDDGWLTGAELRGLALWFDRNGDGTSERGEVVPVSRTAITSLRVHATGRVGRSLVSEGGLRLRDGRVLPTYDWIVTLPPSHLATR